MRFLVVMLQARNGFFCHLRNSSQTAWAIILAYCVIINVIYMKHILKWWQNGSITFAMIMILITSHFCQKWNLFFKTIIMHHVCDSYRIVATKSHSYIFVNNEMWDSPWRKLIALQLMLNPMKWIRCSHIPLIRFSHKHHKQWNDWPIAKKFTIAD